MIVAVRAAVPAESAVSVGELSVVIVAILVSLPFQVAMLLGRPFSSTAVNCRVPPISSVADPGETCTETGATLIGAWASTPSTFAVSVTCPGLIAVTDGCVGDCSDSTILEGADEHRTQKSLSNASLPGTASTNML